MLVAEGGEPAEIVERLDLGASDDAGELAAIVDRAIEQQPDAAAKVRAGEGKAIGAIVGAVMRETKRPCRRRRGDPADPASSSASDRGRPQVTSGTL